MKKIFTISLSMLLSLGIINADSFELFELPVAQNDTITTAKEISPSQKLLNQRNVEVLGICYAQGNARTTSLANIKPNQTNEALIENILAELFTSETPASSVIYGKVAEGLIFLVNDEDLLFQSVRAPHQTEDPLKSLAHSLESLIKKALEDTSSSTTDPESSQVLKKALIYILAQRLANLHEGLSVFNKPFEKDILKRNGFLCLSLQTHPYPSLPLSSVSYFENGTFKNMTSDPTPVVPSEKNMQFFVNEAMGCYISREEQLGTESPTFYVLALPELPANTQLSNDDGLTSLTFMVAIQGREYHGFFIPTEVTPKSIENKQA